MQAITKLKLKHVNGTQKNKRPKLTISQRISLIENKKNRATVERFIFTLQSENIKEKRLEKYTWELRNVSKWLNKEFEKATEDDIRKLVVFISNQNYSPLTVSDYKIALKRFYKWLEGENETFPKKVRWIKNKIGTKVVVQPSDIISKEDVIRMVAVTRNIRNKALIATLYETGVRVGELLNMKLKDIEIGNQKIKISVDGKTGQRTVFVYGFRQHLENWLNSHPFRNNSESYVWIQKERPDSVISQTHVSNMLKIVAHKSGLNEEKANKIHPHLFRHSLATTLATILTEQELKVYMGWTKSSKMAAVYVHLTGADIENSYDRKVHGIDTPNENKKEGIKPKICGACSRHNPPDAKFCNCGTVLDIKTAIEVEEMLKKERTVDKILQRDIKSIDAELQEFEKRLAVLKEMRSKMETKM